MNILGYTFGVLGLCTVLVIFAYLDRIYRELGHAVTGRLHKNLDVFETEIEPLLKIERKDTALGFAILAQLFLIIAAVETARGVLIFVPKWAEAAAQVAV